MSWSINDVDFNASIGDGRVFCQDSDAALALLVVTIHNQLAHLLILAEDMTLLEQTVHKRGFAVIDVSNNGNIANIVSFN